MEKRIVAFDLETTGLAYNDELLQASFIDDKLNVLFSEYVKPVKHTEWPDAMEHNHITPDMVKNARTLDEVKDDIIKILDSADILVGFNSNTFDVKRLEVWLEYKIKASCVDVKSMAEKEFGMYPKIAVSLDDVCNWFGVVNEQAHDSLADTKATMQIFNKMIAESQKPKLAEIFKFNDGKMIYSDRLAKNYAKKTGCHIVEWIYLENGHKIEKPEDMSKYRIGNFIKGEKQFDVDSEIEACTNICLDVLNNYNGNVEEARKELDATLDNYLNNLTNLGASKDILDLVENKVTAAIATKNGYPEEITVNCIATGIDWDIDDDGELSEEELQKIKDRLHTSLSTYMTVDKNATEEEIKDQLVDELSEEYGYCINGIESVEIKYEK